MSKIYRTVSNLTTERLDDEVEASFSDIDGEDADGRTPLSWAAFRGDFRCVRKLLLSGVSANIHARDGCIPLHMAARAGSLPCLKILIRHKSRVDHKDSCGNTALHYTCKSGKTALHYTCKSKTYTRKYLRCAECLLASGADVDAEDLTGKTPLRVCCRGPGAVTFLHCNWCMRTTLAHRLRAHIRLPGVDDGLSLKQESGLLPDPSVPCHLLVYCVTIMPSPPQAS